MTVSERVKQACKERHIPVSKIEQHFGFSNGYIAQMKDEFVPYDRIAKIADYLGTSIQYLMKLGGYTTDSVMKRHYRQSMNDKKSADRVADALTAFVT